MPSILIDRSVNTCYDSAKSLLKDKAMFYQLRQKILRVESRGARATMCFMVIMLTALGIFMSDLYTPSLPTISHYFHVQPHLVKMSLAVYLLGLTFPQLLFGPLSDAIGRKKVIFPGLLIALVGSVCCMQAPNIYSLNVGRFLQGIGIGALTASARESCVMCLLSSKWPVWWRLWDFRSPLRQRLRL